MILICEPNCVGMEHVEINAAFLAVVKHAFSDQNILFLAEKKHIQAVEKTLESQSVEGVDYKAINVPPRRAPEFFRAPLEKNVCRRIFEFAKKQKTYKIFFLSIRKPGLESIRTLQRSFEDIKCLILPHNVLASGIFRQALLSGDNQRILYLLLGDPIREQLCLELPAIKENIRSIDHPYFYQTEDVPPALQKEDICFASFGVGNFAKGTAAFIDIADAVRNIESRKKAEFVLLGPILDRNIRRRISKNIGVPSLRKMLRREEFEQKAKKVDYAVYLYDPEAYRFVASGALFDAFSCLKPIIALRNTFFEHYFKIMGDIGYLCDSSQEVQAVIVDILNSDKSARYRKQQENIRQGREHMSVLQLGEQFRRIWKEV